MDTFRNETKDETKAKAMVLEHDALFNFFTIKRAFVKSEDEVKLEKETKGPDAKVEPTTEQMFGYKFAQEIPSDDKLPKTAEGKAAIFDAVYKEAIEFLTKRGFYLQAMAIKNGFKDVIPLEW